MTRTRGFVCIGGLVASLMAAGTAAASAATFYVSPSGSDANACTNPAAPCKTITKAVSDSEGTAGNATVELAAGVYPETVKLEKPADDGITINGAGSGAGGTELEPPSGATETTANIKVPGGAVTISNLSIVNVSGDAHGGIESNSETTLDNVTVDMQDPAKVNGIVQEEVGSLFVDGGGVTMASGSEGAAIGSAFEPLRIEGASVTVANGSKAVGIESEYAPLSINDTSLTVGNTAGVAIESTGAPTTLTGVSVADGSEKEPGLGFALPESLSLNGVGLTMTNAKDSAPGALVELGGTDTLEGLDVSGAWEGSALESSLANLTLRNSRLIASPTSKSPAIVDEGDDTGPGLFVQRSVVQASATATPGALEAISGNVTLDSSEALGGKDALFFDQAAGKERTLTVAASTIDAGNLGEANEAGVSGVEVIAGETNSVANANIAGSIVLEKQTATVGAGGESATIDCSYTDTPDQTQSATGTEGAIACAAGSDGNTSSTPESLFASPFANYILNPSSSAIDSVPTAKIGLPFGFTPSTTDLAGNPRSEDLDCVALQDKGALELQGRSTPCPVAVPILAPVSPKP
ncbi:MAG: hypothetical protein ACLP1Q_00240, partial [Solirubrobacteraceae bacterium]